MLREAKIDDEAKTLTLALDLDEPAPLSSGKTPGFMFHHQC